MCSVRHRSRSRSRCDVNGNRILPTRLGIGVVGWSEQARLELLLESGRLPHRKVGSHRRIAFDDLIAYAQKMREQQAGAPERRADNARELGLEY